MSLEVESLGCQPEPESQPTLTLQIPSNREPFSLTPPSSSSIHTRPPSDDYGLQTPTTTIETTQSDLTPLPNSSHLNPSSSSLPGLNVKFAPLPELLPRKRRSSVPLGMAARATLVQRRPSYRGRNAPPMWTDEGSEKYRMRQEEIAARLARSSANAVYAAARKEEDEGDDDDDDWPRQYRLRMWKKKGEQMDEDDPLQLFGRMVKVAGKTLWRRVSNKDVGVATATSTPESKEDYNEQEVDGNRYANTGSPPPTKASRLPSPVLRPILGPISSNITSNVDDHCIEEEEEEEEEEGGVWEEEVGVGFPRDVSQTETIVEGRAVYSPMSSRVDVSGEMPPPSPTVLYSRRMSGLVKRPNAKRFPPFKPKLADSGS